MKFILCIALIWSSGFIAGKALAAPAPTPETLTRFVAGLGPGDPATIICQKKEGSWAKVMEAYGMNGRTAGVTWIPERKVLYPIWVCRAIAHPYQDIRRFAVALAIMAHEGAHLSGITDEGLAACWGLNYSRQLADQFYNIPYNSPIGKEIARWNKIDHAMMDPQYRTVCM